MRLEKHLEDLRQAAPLIGEFTLDRTFEEYDRSAMLRYAVELSRRVTDTD